MTTIRVGGAAPYDVLVGRALSGRVPELIGPDAERVALVFPRALREQAQALAGSLRAAGRAVLPLEVPDGEDAKTAAVAASCWSELARAGFTRSDAVLGFGGGAVTDLAGFLGASWLRGVGVVLVPTTLLAMVDAAVGGKTGINLPEGKNLVGAFHPPAVVVCDLDLLATLPRADYVSGLGEILKAGFLVDPVILDLVEADPAAAGTPSGPHTQELVERAIQVKADVVSGDLRERTTAAGVAIGREMLNYGHTLGHAIEKVENYRWRHGEAVSVGLVFAAELACRAGRLSAEVLDRHRCVLGAVGLPLTYRGDRWAELSAAMRVDKKARGSTLRFVVLEGLGRPAILADPDPQHLRDAYAALST